MDEFEIDEESFSAELGLNPSGPPQEGRAFLIGVVSKRTEIPGCEELLEELADLADTFGVQTVGRLPIIARKLDAATFVPSGKLDEIKQQLESTGATLLIFDDEISPAQQRNLEKLFKIPTMDRTELIIEIFAQRAQTKEAKLQIELAKTRYQFPRLKRMWSHFSRQRASGGFLKGEGEKQIELDRRMLKRRLQLLSDELKEVVQARSVQSQQRRRSGIPTVAIVGYTNAGKSTLLRALTQADVLVEDKLFATLDPTTRKFTLPNKQEILLSDTVGLIRKLPHMLVAAFRSTLEAALHDDILLHLIDVSHPAAEAQAKTTEHLLQELGVDQQSCLITVLNKIDLCQDPSCIVKMRLKYPRVVAISAQTGEGFEELQRMLMEVLASRRVTVKLRIPQSAYHLVGLIHREAHILHEEYADNDVMIRAQIPLAMLHHFEAYKQKEETE
ncbi:MAG: GTPase HflX [Verrucomicrobia bacterium]|nr:GTPase HflX [Verrucomicrobiota bacterium]MBS0645964.1 GTPase HflX [Verrucomicrobiota bacterium]